MSTAQAKIDLELPRLQAAYAAGTLTPSAVVDHVLHTIASRGADGVWISVVDRDTALTRARRLEALSADERAGLPLWGVPFSVKDCIDTAGLPTTSACPAFVYHPSVDSPAVARLLAAGAILIGKTNMDQFATGLVGTRSPYGVARNPFDADYIPGGSSSGAAVSVASELVSFALGTDTGGSGRIPAAFNNVVGLKPTRGLISGVGTVPACRSIETVSVFALTVPDARRVFDIVRGFDPEDPFARRDALKPDAVPSPVRFGIPARAALDFFGDAESERLFDAAVRRLGTLGSVTTDIDYTPFAELNQLLFKGPWLAERYGALREIVAREPDALFPVTRAILEGGRSISGADVFAGQQRCLVLRRQIERLWQDIDVLVVPTAGTIERIEAIAADPIERNFRLGTYTNFVNLADLAAVAVPAGFRADGLPFGISLIAPALSDHQLARVAARVHESGGLPLGARAVDPAVGRGAA
ncbi:allophanate hydrolase [Bradyrhizobium sp. HKCCYLR20261]|uniref:allophanate hydrolase n=1 Tax=Bradyrhizobium sp. HKCCYLR20261 TaxID=3420760 RepID=UPI003EB74B45